MDLFSQGQALHAPLAERVRPRTFGDVVGQDHLLGENGTIQKALANHQLFSFILWGPPGTGKTTIAKLVAAQLNNPFVSLSAVMTGIKDVKKVMEEARHIHQGRGIQTLLFIDEIHRFNKAQQDAFLPFVENGDIILMGATTENPSFEVVGALLSRLRVFLVEPLSPQDIQTILEKAFAQDAILQKHKENINKRVLQWISERFGQDARQALQALDVAVSSLKEGESLTEEKLQTTLNKTAYFYDKQGEEHYNIISALHKSIRNSDADAGLYWLARMLESGEDPKYVIRRLIRFASEDIGNADPQALILATAVKDTVEFLGMPECNVALAQLVIYFCGCPKSNSAYAAYKRVQKDLQSGKIYPVPLHIRNAPTKLMKDIGYGKDYQYAHNEKDKVSQMECLPDKLSGTKYYVPVEEGEEKQLKDRLEHFSKWRNTNEA